MLNRLIYLKKCVEFMRDYFPLNHVTEITFRSRYFFHYIFLFLIWNHPIFSCFIKIPATNFSIYVPHEDSFLKSHDENKILPSCKRVTKICWFLQIKYRIADIKERNRFRYCTFCFQAIFILLELVQTNL